MHKSGFVNIIGRPNVGKSTLMNALVGERMSIITNKPQTTRHRIVGIVNDDDFQVVFSDTPGFIDNPSYKMQESMNSFVHSTFKDADLMLFVTEPEDTYPDGHPVVKRLKNLKVPVFLVVNKIDQIDEAQLDTLIKNWTERMDFAESIGISALHHGNTDDLLNKILKYLPEGPKYYPEDQLTDRPERFFVSEIIREKILELYHQEVPYSCEVAIESFKETQTNSGEDLVRISALIFVVRRTQKAILIGKNGSAIKELGTLARKDIETFLEKKVFLELHVKIRDNWRDDDNQLKRFGYQV